jgi:Tfp pilus assembly protein PilZ
MPTIADVIISCQSRNGEPDDPDWSKRQLDIKNSGLFIPRNQPHPFAVWEIIESYARGLSLIGAGKKVGVTSDTAMRWMERAGAPRRSPGSGRELAHHRDRELSRQRIARSREQEVEL